MSAQTTWANRIVGHGEEAPTSLQAHPMNWRAHPRRQQQALTAVLDEVGWVQQVIVNRGTGVIVDGHLRVRLAVERAEPTIPVVYVELTDEEERLVLATFDPIGQLAQVAREHLEALLAGAEPQTDALRSVLAREATAFGISLRAEGRTDPDAIPDPPEHPITQPGDLVILGTHRLLCGDSTSEADLSRLMDGHKAALLATDPPYLVDYDGGNHPQSFNEAPEQGEHWDDFHGAGAAVAFFADYLRIALQHCTPDAAVYQWHATRRQALVESAWQQNNLLVHQSIVWVKPHAVLTRSHFMWQHEPCFYGWRTGSPPERRPPANATTVWPVSMHSEEGKNHPTQKPVELFARPIEYHTAPGEVVLEPFSGSGTQLIAAEQLGRRCFAMEQEPRYVDAAVARWEAFTGHKAKRLRTRGRAGGR